MRGRERLLLAWALAATAIVLWGLLAGNPLAERRYRCHDALIARRTMANNLPSLPPAWNFYVEQIEKWCG